MGKLTKLNQNSIIFLKTSVCWSDNIILLELSFPNVLDVNQKVFVVPGFQESGGSFGVWISHFHESLNWKFSDFLSLAWPVNTVEFFVIVVFESHIFFKLKITVDAQVMLDQSIVGFEFGLAVFKVLLSIIHLYTLGKSGCLWVRISHRLKSRSRNNFTIEHTLRIEFLISLWVGGNYSSCHLTEVIMNYAFVFDSIFELLMEHLIIHNISCTFLLWLRFSMSFIRLWFVEIPRFLSHYNEYRSLSISLFESLVELLNIEMCSVSLDIIEFSSSFRYLICESHELSDIELFIGIKMFLPSLMVHVHLHIKWNEGSNPWFLKFLFLLGFLRSFDKVLDHKFTLILVLSVLHLEVLALFIEVFNITFFLVITLKLELWLSRRNILVVRFVVGFIVVMILSGSKIHLELLLTPRSKIRNSEFQIRWLLYPEFGQVEAFALKLVLVRQINGVLVLIPGNVWGSGVAHTLGNPLRWFFIRSVLRLKLRSKELKVNILKVLWNLRNV